MSKERGKGWSEETWKRSAGRGRVRVSERESEKDKVGKQKKKRREKSIGYSKGGPMDERDE